MVRIIKNLLIISLLVAAGMNLSSCQSENQKPDSPLIVLDMESLLSNQQEVLLSDIAESIKYIKLETNPDVLCQVLQYIVRDNKIYVRNRNGTVYLFDGEGKFIRHIGRKGQGPGEYLGVQYIDASPEGDFVYFYYTRGNIGYVFSSDGEMINDFKIKYPTWRFAALSPDRHVMISPYGAFSPDSLPFLFYVSDGKGQVVNKFSSKKVIMLGSGDFSIGKFIVTPKSVIGYHQFCDTVFSFDQEGNKSPKYVLDYGDKRLPDEEIDDMMKLNENRAQYIHSTSLYESSDKVFVRAYHKKKALIGYWQEKDNSMIAISSESGKLRNDLDGGPDFWPTASDGEKTVYRLLKPVSLVDLWNTGDFEEKEFKQADERKEFIKMIQALDEGENPVIMVVKLK